MSDAAIIKHLHPAAEATAQSYIGSSAPLTVLGGGVAGAVFQSPNLSTAIKVHKTPQNFAREVAAYRRLTSRGIISIQGLNVPKLEGVDANKLVIAMATVRRPYLLDFAGAQLDRCDFTDDAMEAWWESLADRFEERFPIVQNVYWELVLRCGIYYTDFKQGNIEFVADNQRPTGEC